MWRLFTCCRRRRQLTNNTSVLITGAVGGLGNTIAKAFFQKGCRVILWDINAEKLNSLTNELNSLLNPPEKRAYSFVVDISDKKNVAESTELVRKEVGYIDILINNASILNNSNSILDTPDTNIEQLFSVNLLGTIWVLRSFLPTMLSRNLDSDQNIPHIITISSVLGIIPLPPCIDYSISKVAQCALHNNIRQQYNHTQLRTTLVLPSRLKTPLFSSFEKHWLMKIPFIGNYFFDIKPEYIATDIIYAVEYNINLIVVPFTTPFIAAIIQCVPFEISDWILKLFHFSTLSFLKSKMS